MRVFFVMQLGQPEIHLQKQGLNEKECMCVWMWGGGEYQENILKTLSVENEEKKAQEKNFVKIFFGVSSSPWEM